MDLEIASLPAFSTFTYPAISDTIGHTITAIRPSLTSGCSFVSNDLPYGLSLNASTGEITGAVCDTMHTTFTVIAAVVLSVMTARRLMSATTSTADILKVPAEVWAVYAVTAMEAHT